MGLCENICWFKGFGGFWRKIANLAIFGEKSWFGNFQKKTPIWRFWRFSAKKRQFGDFRQKAPIWQFLAKNRQFGDFWRKSANLAIFDEKSPNWRFLGGKSPIFVNITYISRHETWSLVTSQDSSVRRASDSYAQGCGFEPPRGQKWNYVKNYKIFFYKLRTKNWLSLTL